MKYPAAHEPVEPVVFTAGDEHLPARDAVEHIFLPLRISRSASFIASAAVRTCPCEQNWRALRPLTETAMSSLCGPDRHSLLASSA